MSNGGSIVNMSSTLGTKGAVDVGPYVASKHAVIGLTKSAAIEVGERGIRVDAVCPGPIESRMLRAHEAVTFAETDETFADHLPLNRDGTPEEVASLVAFLLSDESKYITGAGIAYRRRTWSVGPPCGPSPIDERGGTSEWPSDEKRSLGSEMRFCRPVWYRVA